MRRTLLWLGLVALSLPLSAPAWALEPLDPMAMSLGGYYSSFANSDVNGTQLNPALVGQQRGWLFLGPNLGFALGTNALGVGNAQEVGTYFSSLGTYLSAGQAASSDPGTLSDRLASFPSYPAALDTINTSGLTLSVGLRTGLAGFKIPVPSFFGVTEPVEAPASKTGPAPRPKLAWGGLGVRAWADAAADITMAAPDVFKAITNLPALDKQLTSDIGALQDTLNSNSLSVGAVGEKISAIRATLNSEGGLGVFTKADAGGSTAKTISVSVANRAYATTAVSLSQPIPLPVPGFPKARAMVGASGKLFLAPGSVQPLGSSAQGFSPSIGSPGTLTVAGKVDLGDQFKALNGALDAFSGDLSKISDLQSQFSNFSNLDYSKVLALEWKTRAANQMGFGLDLGAQVLLTDTWSVGLAAYNPVVIWPGTESVQKLGYTGGKFSLEPTGSTTTINFTDTEPFGLSLGTALQLPLGFSLMGDLRQDFVTNAVSKAFAPPSLQAGLQWNIFNFLYARAGARIGGLNPMYGAGVGMNLFLTHLDLGVAVDPEFRAGQAGVSWGLGF